MKTAVSIPDDLFADAERLTRRLKKSRSQLYAEALREYVARHDTDAVTNALNEIYESDNQIDPAIAAASVELLRRVEW